MDKEELSFYQWLIMTALVIVLLFYCFKSDEENQQAAKNLVVEQSAWSALALAQNNKTEDDICKLRDRWIVANPLKTLCKYACKLPASDTFTFKVWSVDGMPYKFEYVPQ